MNTVYLPHTAQATGLSLTLQSCSDLFKVIPADKDGHCLVQAFCQHTVGLHKKAIMECLLNFLNVRENAERYCQFTTSYNSFIQDMNSYIYLKYFSNDFCDILPKILSECFNVKILIVSRDEGNLSEICISPEVGVFPMFPVECLLQTGYVVLLKTGEHYDALIPEKISHPTAHLQPITSQSEKNNFVDVDEVVLPPNALAQTPPDIEPLTDINTAAPENCVEVEEVVSESTSSQTPPDTSTAAHVNEPKICLKFIGLNVNGFISRSEKGFLTDYLADFDVICVSESKLQTLPPNFFKSRLGDYKPVIKPVGVSSSSKYGGYHGLMALVSPRFTVSELDEECSSECVLWFKITLGEWSCIIGSIYVPVESVYNAHVNQELLYDDVALDVIHLKTKYNLPCMLLGDANAHTREHSDKIELDARQISDFGLDLLEVHDTWGDMVPDSRSNLDTQPVNKSGKG